MQNNSGTDSTSERVTVPVPAGGALTGTLRQPAGTPPVATVTIHPATAVAERLYNGFARYLADHGFAVFTYDYRGTGVSGAPRENRTLRMRDWMSQDVPAAADWMAARFPELPHLAVGHSLGGQALVLGNATSHLAGFVAVASHAGVVAAIEDRPERLRASLVLHVLGPLTALLLGFVPGRGMGLGEDMPAAAMLEWSRWSRRPGYFFDDPGMRAAERAATVDTEVLAVGLTDDLWATPRQIDGFYAHLVNARVERRTYSPADGGVPAIGHMGFFRSGVSAALWPELLAWLTEKSGAARQPRAES
ncbi:alpha/beta fold hydrolase [Arthrobacter sp. zg-ZUI100]|uniref:alpha/beta hydrolase family protein n=1 Tax=Arthrobacter jiangjiafuii TaxID=2817475 RepID=UPI001AED62C7|nr:alpha/beta fold hydrolase [Arthrobacter jiangjiafuii]MBP3035581.1 alpha/beta fold hydrolase [Arthrobacter jiangjiafuii]